MIFVTGGAGYIKRLLALSVDALLCALTVWLAV